MVDHADVSQAGARRAGAGFLRACGVGTAIPVRERLWRAGLALLAIAGLLHYGRLHFEVCSSPWPITIREDAFIEQTARILDPGAAPMYSYDSLPEGANLYGPLYPLVTSAFVRLMPDTPFLAHRLVVWAWIVGSALLIGTAVARRSDFLWGLVACATFYMAVVATPSTAAGPDMMAVFLYVLAFVLASTPSQGWACKLAVCLAGVAALMTKPYGVLILPGYLLYLAVSRSWREGIVTGFVFSGIGVAALMLSAQLWPAYFSSVFGMHYGTATRILSECIAQFIEFGYLYAGFVAAFLVGFRWRAVPTLLQRIFCPWRTSPVDRASVPFDQWMVLVAVGVLAAFLGWHGGAYMIYFVHLLLPPLLVASLAGTSRWQAGRAGLIAANLAGLLWLVPAQPTAFDVPRPPRDASVWIDPFLRPLAESRPGIHVIDNSQSEYVTRRAHGDAEDPMTRAAIRWVDATRARLESEPPDFLMLLGYYDRELFIHNWKISEFVASRYAVVSQFEVYPYYLAFRKRQMFGTAGATVYVLARRNSSPSESSTGTPDPQPAQ